MGDAADADLKDDFETAVMRYRAMAVSKCMDELLEKHPGPDVLSAMDALVRAFAVGCDEGRLEEMVIRYRLRELGQGKENRR